MSVSDARWRPMARSDLNAVAEIAAQVHPDFFEEDAVFAERRDLYPAGARLLECEGRPAGYLFSHPWRLGDLPALNTLLGALPDDPSTYYLHDLALLPSSRGTGAAVRIVGEIASHARSAGFPNMSLVAVNGSQGFWHRMGFEADHRPGLAGKLASYCEDAAFMVRRLV